MNAVAYLRVSSRAQDFATQKAAIARAAAARGAKSFWQSKAAREYAVLTMAGFLAAAVALASLLRSRRAA